MKIWSYLRFLANQVKSPRWRRTEGAHRTNLPAVRESRQRSWPQCTGCLKRVPPEALHDMCGRAGPYVPLIRAPWHGGPCCRGYCPGCRACLDTPRVEAGWCQRCNVCLACCSGHSRHALRERSVS